MARINLKTRVSFGLVVIVGFCGAAATTLKPERENYQNLKVLPKNISSKDLQGIMVDDFEDGLGVTCGFCHASAKNGHGLDFESDEKPEKEIARAMMRMTIGINRKYFKQKHILIGSNDLTVTCNTCHKGEAFPGSDAGQK
jgi:Photosynthetic reaction centre cytochrome C subunit